METESTGFILLGIPFRAESLPNHIQLLMKKILLLLLSTSLAMAQDTKVILGYGPGGTDSVVRTVTSDAEKLSGRSFIVENRPGANGQIALKNYLDAPPANTILAVTGGQIMIEPIIRPENNNLSKLKIIGPVIHSPMALATAPASKIQTLDDLFNKQVPKQRVNIAVAGEAHQMLIVEIAKHSHHDVQGVNFNGSAAGTTALIGGHVDLQVDLVGYFKPKLPAIIILGVAQASAVDNTPSLHKFIPSASLSNFAAFAIPKGTSGGQIEQDLLNSMSTERIEFFRQTGYAVDINKKGDYLEREVLPRYKALVKKYKAP